MTVGLLTIHGMGTTKPGYEKSLVKALKQRLGDSAADNFTPYPVYYQDLLQENEKKVWEAVENLVHYDDLRRFILYGFADAAGLENRKEVLGSVYESAQRRIADQMINARKDKGADAPLVIIAQSLGGQVLSSFLWDARLAVKAQSGVAGATYPVAGIFRRNVIDAMEWNLDDLNYLAGSHLAAIYTTGCNIPIFVAAHQKMNIKPIEAPNERFRWINYYDPDDVLGWPLQPLKNGYETLVQDRRINSGSGATNFILKSWNPISHGTYWTDDDVIKALADEIAELAK